MPARSLMIENCLGRTMSVTEMLRRLSLSLSRSADTVRI